MFKKSHLYGGFFVEEPGPGKSRGRGYWFLRASSFSVARRTASMPYAMLTAAALSLSLLASSTQSLVLICLPATPGDQVAAAQGFVTEEIDAEG